MAITPHTSAVRKPATRFAPPIVLALSRMSGIWRITAPMIAGIDIRNENSAAFSAVRRDQSPTVMVPPERDTPGRIAIAWKTPISSAIGYGGAVGPVTATGAC